MDLERISPADVDGRTDDGLARSWLACVHASLRDAHTRARILGPHRPPGPGWNYYSVLVGSPTSKHRLLLNAAGRLVAASNHADVPIFGPLDFIDVPHPRPFVHAGFVVLSATYLRTPLTGEHTAALSESQRADVDYHRPDRIGDLIFNWFD